MFRRHPLLSVLGILFFLFLVATAVFIATFDLNRYRVPLQAELSERLSEPVHLGEAHLSLTHGPSLMFSDLTIGSGTKKGTLLRVKHLYLQLRLWPLLEGRLIFAKALVDTPQVRLVLNPPPAPASKKTSAPLPEKGPLLRAAGMFRSLTLRHGTLRFIDHRNPARPFSATLKKINGTISDLSFQKPTDIHLAGELDQNKGASTLSLDGTFTPAPTPFDWAHGRLEATLHLRDFGPGPFLVRYGSGGDVSAQGKATIKVTLSGIPATGLAVKASLVGAGLALQFPPLYQNPLELTSLSLSGAWITSPGADRLDHLTVTANGMTIRGQLTLEKKDDSTYLDGDLSSSELPVTKLIGYLPGEGGSSTLARIKKTFRGGALQINRARFAGPVSAYRHLNKDFPLQSAQATLKGGVVSLPQPGPLTAISVTASYADHRLALKDGQALLGETPLRFDGSLTGPFLPAPQIAMEASGTLPIKNLLALFPRKTPEGFSAGGTLPVVLTLGGTTHDLLAHLQADLKPLDLRFKQDAAKPAGLEGTLSLSAEFTPGHLTLKKGVLKIAPLELRVSGDYTPSEKTFQVTADVPDLVLDKILPLVPVLTELHPQGSLSIHYQASGAAGEIHSCGGTIALHNFGIHLTREIADLNHVNGQILLSANSARFQQVTGKLGTSLVRLRGTLENFTDPRFNLRVRAATIGGEDLFFFSKSALLHHLNAHLIIDRRHLSFAPATVRLVDGTKVTVRGAVRDFKSPWVNLNIKSDQANIDHVIALWQGPPSEKKPKRTKPAPKVSLFILATVKKGTLGELHFERAQGEITLHGEALYIYPLHFHAGKGYCTGQVVVDRQAGAPPLLKISGHLEHFDAAAIYRQLLKKRGLITGTLEGDFYLQGRAGKNFLPTSMGGFNMEVKKGVLHKFQFLSKVFSLLNVSQILTFRLPDMSLEGMPFDRLKGTFTLRRGILSTDNLFVDSHAMNLSLVGRMNLQNQKVDLILGVKPLKTVDKIITHIPIAGWLLTGKEKALITAYFKIHGKSDDPKVVPIPITSVSDKVLGIFKRVFGLPGKLITDMGELMKEKKGK